MGAIGQNRATTGPASPNRPGCGRGSCHSGDCATVAATNRHRQQVAAALCAPGIDRVARWSPFGGTRRYDATMERRILEQLDQPPPSGYAVWNGSLVAEALGDVSTIHVWRVLRGRGIQLQRRRSWCVSTDPEFSPKAADIVGLYLILPRMPWSCRWMRNRIFRRWSGLKDT